MATNLARPSLLILAVLATVSAGCASRRLTLPPAPVPATQRTDLSDVALSLCDFSITGNDGQEGPMDVEPFQDRFLDYLESTTQFRDVTYNLSNTHPTDDLQLSVAVELVEHTRHTYVLDLLNVPMVGLWPLVPAWGEAEVNLSVRLTPPDGTPVELQGRVSAPYTILWFAWYRNGPLEEAFARGTTEAFERMAAAIPAAAAGLVNQGAAGEPTGLSPAPVDAVDPTPSAIQLGATQPDATQLGAIQPGTIQQDVDWHVTLPSEGMRVIETRPPPGDGFVATMLGALGGVELVGFKGLASVSSTARLKSGAKEEVASGTAAQTGYRVGLYSAPLTTGWFVSPALGYVRQKIDNVDTRSQLFQLNSIQPELGDIPATATDPDSGGDIDAGAENVYHLDMQSGYAGARVGMSFVAGTPSVELFTAVSLSVNVLEYRTIRSLLDNCEAGSPASVCQTKHQGWDLLRSGALGATVGLRLPDLHMALRFIFDYEVYFHFEYEHPLEVRGPAVYDADNQIFQHEMLSMRGASLSSASFQLALAVVY